MYLNEKLVDRECDEDHRKDDRGIEDQLLHAAPCLVVSLATAAQKAGHAGRPLLQEDERYDDDRKNDLDDGDYHGYSAR